MKIILLIILAVAVGCGGPGVNVVPPITAEDSGKQMVIQYCSSCHLPVQPGVLDKKSWTEHVLPAMAEKMGIKVWNGNQYYPATGNAQSLISFNDWTKLVDYFDRTAPDSIPVVQSSDSISSDWFQFALKKPAFQTPGISSSVLVAFDTISNKIITADNDNDLYSWNSSLKKQSVFRLPAPAVNIAYSKDATGLPVNYFTLIGTMQAIDEAGGSLVSFDIRNPLAKPVLLTNGIPRPVESVPGDFNKDGLEDWLICGFGHERGALFLVSQKADHTFSKKVLRDIAGATQVITGDFNKDGWLDFYCLFAHGDEGIWLFTNDKQGGFSSENILRFPPYYGSTSFQLVDFNNDGKLDILYTCGDNSDYSRILKPFHGLYIFLNEGSNKFRQSWFYHVNGSTKAMVADFNADGKPDIASIAFFADLKDHPSEKFILFEQIEAMKFQAHSPPISDAGRWICMDVKDYDHDGDPDIILGNYSRGFINQEGFKANWDEHTPFVILENKR